MKTLSPIDTHNATPAKEVIQKCGGTAIVREALGIKRQSMHAWDVIPLAHCLTLERLFKFPAADMRPDLFPADGQLMPRGTWVDPNPAPKPKQRPEKLLRKQSKHQEQEKAA